MQGLDLLVALEDGEHGRHPVRVHGLSRQSLEQQSGRKLTSPEQRVALEKSRASGDLVRRSQT